MRPRASCLPPFTHGYITWFSSCGSLPSCRSPYSLPNCSTVCEGVKRMNNTRNNMGERRDWTNASKVTFLSLVSLPPLFPCSHLHDSPLSPRDCRCSMWIKVRGTQWNEVSEPQENPNWKGESYAPVLSSPRFTQFTLFHFVYSLLEDRKILNDRNLARRWDF